VRGKGKVCKDLDFDEYRGSKANLLRFFRTLQLSAHVATLRTVAGLSIMLVEEPNLIGFFIVRAFDVGPETITAFFCLTIYYLGVVC
jgi:hypothetical protein